MKTLFCYTDVPDARAEAAIRKYAPQAEFYATHERSTYTKIVADNWNSGEDLVVIEGDKVITADVIPSFESCNEPWCVFEYWNYPPPYQQNTVHGLGCTKYSAETQRQVPVETLTVKHDTWMYCPDCENNQVDGCWRYLDTRIALQILSRCIVFSPHVHGRIEHVHEYTDEWKRQRGLQ